jgi:hypothetical protein
MPWKLYYSPERTTKVKGNSLVKNYSHLTPEERWRLIVAASSRGDEVERDCLVRTGSRITLSMRDHAPYAHAFDEAADLMFIVLLEDANQYHDARNRCIELVPENNEDAEGSDPEDEQDTKIEEDPQVHADHDESIRERYFDLLLVSGYILKANVGGWKLFCEKLNIPPFIYWEMLPGFHRLQDALALAEKVAFTQEGFLKWLNRTRPEGEPELTKAPLNVDELAAGTEMAFRQRVQWWGGE